MAAKAPKHTIFAGKLPMSPLQALQDWWSLDFGCPSYTQMLNWCPQSTWLERDHLLEIGFKLNVRVFGPFLVQLDSSILAVMFYSILIVF